MGNSRSSRALASPDNDEQPRLSINFDVEPSRKRYRLDQEDGSPALPPIEPQAKRKKLKSTTQYIYDALFVHGENSDVTIRSLGREWKLHKVYLRQAGYFRSMFHNQWKESSMQVIDLQIPDNNIDEAALDITFGSLYSEDVLICSTKVVSILAAASLIQLEGLMQQCAEVMQESVCLENICLYFKTACMYGQEEVSKKCIRWLETNLMTSQSCQLLSEIEPSLIAEVISSPNLIVIQIEMDIYTILKKWLYLRVNPSYTGDFKGISYAADSYFRQEAKNTNTIFLDSERGKSYVSVFKALRLQHIIRDFVSCREIEKDQIIPWSWLSPLYRLQWLTMLRVEQSIDIGPKRCDSDEFERNGLRCGRLIMQDTDHCWRWNGYNFGLDLLVSYSSRAPRTISLKRNFQSQRCSSSVSPVAARNVIFRLLVASVNDRGHTILRMSTGSTPLTLEREEEKVVLTIERDGLPESISKSNGWNSCFPLLITATFQLASAPAAAELVEKGHGIHSLPLMNTPAPTLGESESAEFNDDDSDSESE